jgi:voltage-gated potassium channel
MVSKSYGKFIWSGIALIGLLTLGVIGYWLIGDGRYSLIDTLYMTVITITTIGFSEIVDLSASPGGRVFTMFIAVSGIGIMGYVATNFTVLLLEGQITNSFRRRRMENTAKNSKGHYIVCGASDIGSHIIRELNSTGRGCVVIDKDNNRLEKALAIDKSGIFIEGDTTNNDILLKAGVESAKGLFAVTGDDNLNLVTCLTARQLNPSLRVVAECHEASNEEKLKKVGADSVISPNYIGGLRIVSEMVRPSVTSFLDIMLRDRDKNLRVEEITVPEWFPETSLTSSGFKRYAHSLLLAVKDQRGWLYNPPDSYIIRHGLILVFMTTPEGRVEIEESMKSR